MVNAAAVGLLVGGLAVVATVPVALLGWRGPAEIDPPPAIATARAAVAPSGANDPRWRRNDTGTTSTSVFARPAPTSTTAGTAPAQPEPGGPPLPAMVLPAARPASAAGLSPAVPTPVRRWEPLIVAEAARHGVDPNLVAALMLTESGGDPKAVSPKNAVGLMQVLHGPAEPTENVAAGVAILAGHLARFGSAELALAAYNAGAGAVLEYGGVPPYGETQWHVYKTLTAWVEFARA